MTAVTYGLSAAKICDGGPAGGPTSVAEEKQRSKLSDVSGGDFEMDEDSYDAMSSVGLNGESCSAASQVLFDE